MTSVAFLVSGNFFAEGVKEPAPIPANDRVLADEGEEPEPLPSETLEGRWLLVATEDSDGRKEFGDATLNIENEKWWLSKGDEKSDPIEIRSVDYSSDPNTIDFVDGFDVIEAIFRIDGDKMELCASFVQILDRPTEFNAVGGYRLFEYRRIRNGMSENANSQDPTTPDVVQNSTPSIVGSWKVVCRIDEEGNRTPTEGEQIDVTDEEINLQFEGEIVSIPYQIDVDSTPLKMQLKIYGVIELFGIWALSDDRSKLMVSLTAPTAESQVVYPSKLTSADNENSICLELQRVR